MTADKIMIAPPAAFEIANAATAYDATRPGLGQEFLDQVRDAADTIVQVPRATSVVHERFGIRRRLLRRFPYFLLYRARPSSIEVLALQPSEPATGIQG